MPSSGNLGTVALAVWATQPCRGLVRGTEEQVLEELDVPPVAGRYGRGPGQLVVHSSHHIWPSSCLMGL